MPTRMTWHMSESDHLPDLPQCPRCGLTDVQRSETLATLRLILKARQLIYPSSYHAQGLLECPIMLLSQAVVACPMHAFRPIGEVFQQIRAAIKAHTNVLGSHNAAVARGSLPRSVGKSVAMTTRPRQAMGRIKLCDMSAALAPEPQPKPTKGAGHPHMIDHLVSDRQAAPVPVDLRGADKFVVDPPAPRAVFGLRKVACPLKGTNVNFARLPNR